MENRLVASLVKPDAPVWTWTLRAVVVATIIPFWRAGHLPIADLPQHVAEIASLRHFFDPAWRVQEHFTLVLGKTQYLLYYLAGAVLAVPLGSAERANIVLLSAIAVALPYALRSALRAFGRDERLALFGCVLFWNQALIMGFFNYLAALPVTLWCVAAAARQMRDPTRARGAAIALGAVAVFYLHVLAFVVCVLAIVCCAWWLDASTKLRVRLGALPRRLVYLVPAALCSLLWFVGSDVIQRPLREGAPALSFAGPLERLARIPDALLDIWWSRAHVAHAFVALAAIVAILWTGRIHKSATAERKVLAVLSASCAAFYLLLPSRVGFAMFLNERYAIWAVLFGVMLLPRARGRAGALALALTALAGIWASANATGEARAFDMEVGRFDEVLARAQPGKRTLALIFDNTSYTAKFPPYVHFGAYYRARYGGVATFSFAGMPQSPFRYRDEAKPPKSRRGEWNPCSFRNAIEGSYYDYVLVRGSIDPFSREPPGPRWRRIAHDGSWSLFERVAGAEVPRGAHPDRGPCSLDSNDDFAVCSFP
jgi:ABC-type arginine/histidine transport system permease subunit